MKTAEQIAEKLWEKGSISLGPNRTHYMSKDGFLAALKEYGAAVRQKAAGVCRVVAEDHWPGLDAGASDKCAAAIERMELP